MNTTATEWLHGLWRFYLAYTKTGVHAAATAGLAIFGLLVFVDDTFVVLAIASYVLPPVILYVVADDPMAEYGPDDSERSSNPSERARSRVDGPGSDLAAEPMETAAVDRRHTGANIDMDSDTDSDADGNGSDTDTDADREDSGDTDADSDTDADDGDSDADT